MLAKARQLRATSSQRSRFHLRLIVATLIPFTTAVASFAQVVFESATSAYTYVEDSDSRRHVEGDGCDERTSWVFDFSGHLDSLFVENLPSLGELTSARLTIIFSPGDEHVEDPRVCNLPGSLKVDEVENNDGIEIVAYGEQSYQLLDYYAADIILSKLGEDGTLSMFFESDARVEAPTRLSLEFEGCPQSKRVLTAPLIRWSNPSGGSFTESGNWEGGKTPGRDSIAVFGIGGSSYTTFLDQAVQNNRVDVDGDLVIADLNGAVYSLAGEAVILPSGTCAGQEVILVLGETASSSLTFERGTVVAQDGDVVVGRGIHESSLNVSSAALETSDASTIWIGETAGAAGTLLVEQSGTVSSGGQITMAEELNSTAFLQVNDVGSRVSAQLIVVGKGGTAEAAIRNRGVVESDFVVVGSDAGSRGTLSVSGVGSVVRNSSDAGEFVVGVSGQGEVVVESGAEIVQSGVVRMVIARETGSTGNLIIRNPGSAVRSEGLLGIGDGGEGRIELLEGATASFLGLGMGGSTSASAYLTVDGQGSMLQIGADPARVEIAQAGTASIEVLAGGAIESGTNIVLGAEPSDPSDYGRANLILSGWGSRIRAPGFAIGERGVATATVENEGVLQVEELWIGFVVALDSALNRMDVRRGGVVTAPRVLVGGAPASLGVTDGGRLTTEILELGLEGGVDADLSVSGVGSIVSVTSHLIVGTHPSSHATVTVDAGALLIASQVSINGNVNGTITVGSTPPKNLSTGIHADTLWIGPRAGFDRDSLVVLAGGVVGGTGSFPGNYRNDTVIAPGYGPQAVGTFSIDGVYHQTMSGALAVELRGQSEGDYDRLVVADSAVIDGRLSVRRVGGFTPRVGDVYEILRAEKLVGQFASIEIVDFKADVVYNGASVQLHITSGVSIEPSEKPTQHFSLHQNFPNPFNPVTTIAFDLPERSTVRLSLYDILGREVRVLDAGERSAGRHEIVLDAHGLPSGSYYYRIEAGQFAAARTLIIVK